MIKLIVKEGLFGVSEFLLKEGTTILGREAGCDIALNTEGVSRRHAKISWTQESLVISDLQSSNGTFVNGIQIKERALLRGDIISLSDVVLEVRIIQDEVPIFQRGSNSLPKNFKEKFKIFLKDNIESQVDSALKATPLWVLFGCIFTTFLVINVFFTLGPAISEGKKNLKSEAMARGISYVNFIADRNESAILQNQISRLNVDYLDGIQGMHSVRIVQPRVLEDGRIVGDILAPMGRGTAMVTQEKWQRESLGEVKLVRDAQGKETYVVESSLPVIVRQINPTRMIFSKPIMQTIEGRKTIAALTQVELNIAGMDFFSTTFWAMFAKAFFAALFLGCLFSMLIFYLIEHVFKLLEQEVASGGVLEGKLIRPPAAWAPMEKVVSAFNHALEGVRNRASHPEEVLREDSYEKDKLQAILQIAYDGVGILDFSNRIVSCNMRFENFLMIPEGKGEFQNIVDVIEDKGLLNNVLELLKKKTQTKAHLTRQDGRKIEINMTHVKNDRGSIEYVVLATHEVQ